MYYDGCFDTLGFSKISTSIYWCCATRYCAFQRHCKASDIYTSSRYNCTSSSIWFYFEFSVHRRILFLGISCWCWYDFFATCSQSLFFQCRNNLLWYWYFIKIRMVEEIFLTCDCLQWCTRYLFSSISLSFKCSSILIVLARCSLYKSIMALKSLSLFRAIFDINSILP